MIDIKFIPTGNIFSLPDEEATRIVKEDRGNYEVVKGKIKEDEAPQKTKSVQELVVDESKNKQNKNKTKNETKTTETITETTETNTESETENK